MGIKLVALDMDGTVLNSAVQLAPETREAVKEAIAKDVFIVPCTGRVFSQLPADLMAIPGIAYAVTANGARVTSIGRPDEPLYHNPIAPDDMRLLRDIFQEYPVMVEVYIDGETYIERAVVENMGAYGLPEAYFPLLSQTCHAVDGKEAFLDFLARHAVEKVNIFCPTPAIKTEIGEHIGTNTQLTITSSMAANMELNDKTASKGDGLDHLCRRLGIDRGEVMAVGDSSNDLEMLKFAGVSVAMGNAEEKIKDMCDFITTTNDAFGVARALDRFVV
jgi:Cof subfamily protein (haloacid dehalogenase superfamily)